MFEYEKTVIDTSLLATNGILYLFCGENVYEMMLYIHDTGESEVLEWCYPCKSHNDKIGAIYTPFPDLLAGRKIDTTDGTKIYFTDAVYGTAVLDVTCRRGFFIDGLYAITITAFKVEYNEL